jgi:hypothetical protein
VNGVTTCVPESRFLRQLRGRITLQEIPFSEAGSRMLVFRRGSHLLVRLAERWYKWEAEVGSYRQRRPTIDDWVITDESGTPLDLEVTTYPHALCVETRIGHFWLAFAGEETLYLKLPPARLGLAFRVYAIHGSTDRRGGEFKDDTVQPLRRKVRQEYFRRGEAVRRIGRLSSRRGEGVSSWS